MSYSLYHLDWPVFVNAFSKLSVTWLSLSIATLLLTMILRAWRWQMIAGIPAGGRFDVWRACCIGYAGTAIFPARAGEVMRVVSLQRSPFASTGLAIGSSLLDRLVDAIALCALIGLGLFMFVSSAAIERGFSSMFVAVLIVCCLTAGFLASGKRAQVLLNFVSGRSAFAVRAVTWAQEAFSELRPLQTKEYWARIVSLQIVISLLDVFACWVLIWAFGWNLPFEAAYFTLLCLAIAATLPSTPGYVGVYQVAAMASLSMYGVVESKALAYGTLLQVCTFLLFLSAGAWAYWYGRHAAA